MLSANKNGTGLAGLLCMALVVMLFASMFTNAESTQMFYPNGRYGRRSDPDLKPIVGVDNDLGMNLFVKCNLTTKMHLHVNDIMMTFA